VYEQVMVRKKNMRLDQDIWCKH